MPSIPRPTPDQLQSKSHTSKVKQSKVKQSKVKQSKVNKHIQKKQFLDNVFLTESEHSKLLERFGQNETRIWIEKLDSYIGSKGKKYKSHYKTIISWSLKENVGTKDVKSKTQCAKHGRDYRSQESQYGQAIDV